MYIWFNENLLFVAVDGVAAGVAGAVYPEEYVALWVGLDYW